MKTSISRKEFLKLSAMIGLASSGVVNTIDTISAASANGLQPNILVILFDAFSAKNASLYGYFRETTPNINRFAQKATVFHNHYSPGNYTTPGTASLFTGALPWTHHAFQIKGKVLDDFLTHNLFRLAPQGIYTNSYTHNHLVITLLYQFRKYLNQLVMPRELALLDAEYSDIIFNNDFNVSHAGENIIFSNEELSGSLFLSFLYKWFASTREQQLNTQYEEQFPRGVPKNGPLIFRLEDSIDWIIEQLKTVSRPFMTYAHLLPPHNPYTPRREFNKLFYDKYDPPEKLESFASEGIRHESLVISQRRYDRHIAYCDSEFGRLINTLEQSGAMDNTYVILTSDHGELFERGIRGHSTPVLYEPLIRIPLVISRPDSDSRVDVYERTSAIDILPTITSIYGQDAPPLADGQILPTFTDRPLDEERTIYAMDSRGSPKNGPVTKGSFAVINGDYKLVHYSENPEYDELFNITNDPEELENLISTHKGTTSELMGLLTEQLSLANQEFSSRS